MCVCVTTDQNIHSNMLFDNEKQIPFDSCELNICVCMCAVRIYLSIRWPKCHKQIYFTNTHTHRKYSSEYNIYSDANLDIAQHSKKP